MAGRRCTQRPVAVSLLAIAVLCAALLLRASKQPATTAQPSRGDDAVSAHGDAVSAPPAHGEQGNRLGHCWNGAAGCWPELVTNGPKCLPSQSQDSEEALVTEYFGWHSKNDGFYVELGALDGVTLSNTLSLHTCNGWSGVLVEGMKKNFGWLKQNIKLTRPAGVDIHWGAICAPPTTSVVFTAPPESDNLKGAVQGVVDQMSEGFKARWHPDAAHETTIDTPCHPMDFYLKGVAHVDFFSLDIEGTELEVMSTIDFTKVTVEVFMIEFDGLDLVKEWKIRHLLRNVGYHECKKKTIPRSGLFVRAAGPYAEKC